VFVQSLVLFAAGSIVVAAAPSFAVLLAGRAIQAFGAGGLFPVASAVVADTFPAAQRGRALGMLGAVFGLAFLLGPTVAGFVLLWDWRWLFIVNVPIAAVLIAAGAAILPGRPAVVHERGPFLPRELVRHKQLQLVAAVAFAAGLVEAAMVFLPDIAVLAFEVSESRASWMMLPLVGTLLCGAPTAGILLDRIGPRPVLQGGLVFTIFGLALFAALPLSKAVFFAAGMAVGLGLAGLLGAPLRYIVLREAGEHRRGAGQGLLTLVLGFGQIAGAGLVGVLAGGQASELGGYRYALGALAAACALALAVTPALRSQAVAGALSVREPGTGS
jgi:MFS family permease